MNKYSMNKLQAGLVFKNGIFQRVITKEGTYRFLCRKMTVVKKRQSLESQNVDAKLLPSDGEALNMIQTFTIPNGNFGLHFVDGIFDGVLTSGNHTFFKTPFTHSVEIINKSDYELPKDLNESIKWCLVKTGLVNEFFVDKGHKGALFIDGVFIKMLDEGRYMFIVANKRLFVKIIDTRKRTMQVNGQEILTADKVDLRVNFALTFTVTDSKRAITEYDNYSDALYLLFQLALREYISAKTLDEILDQKTELGSKILVIIKPREKEFGAQFIEAGIKDIILPGDIKSILNTVLIAQKQAQANVITRREETASTRSLLNTAKLLDENKTLYRLKELEYLEKICQNVSHISLGGNGNTLEQLSQMLGKPK